MFGSYANRASRRFVNRRVLEVEQLSDRITPAVIVVNSAANVVDATDMQVTLPEAVMAANANQDVSDTALTRTGNYGNDTITFNIAGAGPHTITLAATLSITDSLTIDGFSQAGASANTFAVGSNVVRKIKLDGNNNVPNGVDVSAKDSVIKGLEITRFTSDGVKISGSDSVVNVKIQGNLITLNGSSGVGIYGDVKNNLVGGLNPQDRNTISKNVGGADSPW